MITISANVPLLSNNHIYGLSYRHMYMKPEAVKVKIMISAIASKYRNQLPLNKELGYKLVLRAAWYNKTTRYSAGQISRIKKRDSNNMLKLLIDGLCDGLRIDDKQFFHEEIIKEHSDTEGFDITIYELEQKAA